MRPPEPGGGLLASRVGAWRRRLIAGDGIEGALEAFSWSGAIFLALALLDRALALPFPVRLAGFALLAAALARGLWTTLVRPFLRWTPERVIAAAQDKHPGLGPRLLPSWELSRSLPPHVSGELAAAQRDQTEKLLRGVPEALFPWRRPRALPAAAAVAACLALSWGQFAASRLERVLAPWRRVALESLLDIEPRGARVPWGGAATLSARWLKPSEEKPILYVSSPDGPWREQDWDAPASGAPSGYFSWAIPSVSEELRYRVGWRDQTSDTYSLLPVPYPQFADVRYRLTPPLAAAAGVEEVPGGGDIQALKGTKVEILGTTPDAVESALLKVQGRPPAAFEKQADGAFKASFIVEGDGSFHWELSGPGGIRDPQPAEHKITAIEDQPPSITLLSPTFELQISPRETLPVDFSATDDFGLTGVWLVSRARLGGLDSGEKTVRVEGLPAGGKDWNGEYRWDLSDFLPGSRVEFYLKAADNARPPHVSRSETGVLSIVDFDAIHKDAQAKRDAVAAQLRRLAASGEDVAKALERAAADPSQESRARDQESSLRRQWRQALEDQQQALRALQDDPYQNPGVQQSDQEALQDLAQAAQDSLQQASGAMAAPDLKSAAQAHRELAQEAAGALRRLDEDSLYQDMQDFAQRSKNLDRSGDALRDSLERMSHKKKPSDADWKALDKALQDLQDQMTQLAQEISKFSRQAHNDVASKEKVYSVPLQDAASRADALRSALASRDLQGALAAARALSQELSRMQSALEQAQADSEPSQAQRPSQALEKFLEDWQAAEAGQEQRVDGARSFEDARLKRLLQAQKDLLAELARRQKAVNARAAVLVPALPPEMGADMDLALREFTAEKLERAPQALERTSVRLALLASMRPDQAASLQELRAQEQDILALLGRGASAPAPSPSAQAAMGQEAARENGENGRVEALRREADSLRADGSLLDPKASGALAGASAETAAAAAALGQGDSQTALGHAQKALDDLQKGRQSAEQALQRQQSMEAALELPAPGGQRMLSQGNGGAGGALGAQVAPVKLPSSSDYEPPQAVRQQVMESLQEKMPASQQPAIKQYLRNVAE